MSTDFAEFIEHARRGNTAALNEMVDANLIKQKDSIGFTALHWASTCGHPEAVQALLKAGSDINATCSHGDSALHLAAKRNFVEVAKILVDANIDCELLNKDSATAFDLATTDEMRQIIKKVDGSIVKDHESDSE